MGTDYEQAIAADLLGDPTIKAIWIAAFAGAVASEALKTTERPQDRTVGMYAAMEAVVQFALGKDYEIRDRFALARALYMVVHKQSKGAVERAEG
jgi:hypothetical protein